MSYHKSINLREIFNTDLSNKIMKGIGLLNYEDLKYNCSNLSKEYIFNISLNYNSTLQEQIQNKIVEN